MKIRRKRNREGYTLLELILVLAILVILSTVMVPQTNWYVDVARKVTARMEAVEVADAVNRYLKDHVEEGTLDMQAFKVLVNLQLDKPDGPLKDYIGVCQEESRIESINVNMYTGFMSQITYINNYDRVRVAFTADGKRTVTSNASQF